MDHLFIMMDVTSLRLDKAVIKGITMLRTDDKGNQILAITQNAIQSDIQDYDLRLKLAFDEFKDSGIVDGEFIIVGYFGHDFYKPLIEMHCDKHGVSNILSGKPWLSLEQIAWPLYFDNTLSDRKIETLAKHLGIVSTDKLWLLHQCYWTLMRRLTTGVLFESKAREKGGRFFEAAQQFVRRF